MTNFLIYRTEKLYKNNHAVSIFRQKSNYSILRLYKQLIKVSYEPARECRSEFGVKRYWHQTTLQGFVDAMPHCGTALCINKTLWERILGRRCIRGVLACTLVQSLMTGER